MAGFLDNIDTSEVKYTENYRPISKSTTMKVDTDIKKRLNEMALDKDTSIKSIIDKVLEEFLKKIISIKKLIYSNFSNKENAKMRHYTSDAFFVTSDNHRLCKLVRSRKYVRNKTSNLYIFNIY